MNSIVKFIARSAAALTIALPVGSAYAATPDHIVIVTMENHGFDDIYQNPLAAYINNTLVGSGGLLYTQSHAMTHPSQPNYLQFFSGSSQGVAGDTLSSGVPFTTPNMASVLSAAGKTWVEYNEGMTKAKAADANGIAIIDKVQTLTYSIGYTNRHDPAHNWLSSDPTANQLAASADQDFNNFKAGGIDFSLLPSVSYVVPNTKNDMHDGDPAASVGVGDAWLQNNLNNYLTWAKTHNSLLILTFDEDDFSANNHIFTVINGDSRLFQAGISDQLIDHYDVSCAIVRVMGGASCPGAADSATGLAYADGKFTATTPAVPLPAGLPLLMSGLSALGVLSCRKKLK